MISDLLPSAGDEKRHTKGESEYSLSQLSKLHSLTHTHTPFLTLPSTLPPLESNRTGCAIVDQVPSFFHENLFDERRRRRRRTTASETFDIHSYSHAPSSSLPISKKRQPQQQHSAFQSGGIVGGKFRTHLLGHWPLEPLQQVSKTTRYTPRQPVDRLYQGRHGECTIRCGPAAPDTLFGISSCVDDIDCFGDYFVM